MKSKKVMAVILVSAMIFGMLAGCGNKNDTTGVTKTNEDVTGGAAVTEDTNANSEGAIELDFLYWADGKQKELVEKACATYEEETGTHINAEALPADETFETYIQTRKEAGNLPDVSYMGEADIMKYNEMGILADIDDLFISGKIPDKLDAVTIKSAEGKIIGVGLSN